MRALLDDADKNQFAAAEPLLGWRHHRRSAGLAPLQPSTTARGSPPSISTTRFWLRHTGTKRLAGSARRSPIQPLSRRRKPGPLEAGCGVIIVRSHSSPTFAHPPTTRQAEPASPDRCHNFRLRSLPAARFIVTTAGHAPLSGHSPMATRTGLIGGDRSLDRFILPQRAVLGALRNAVYDKNRNCDRK